jgi:ribosomal protein S18 acetylase RimI-like enzyme
MTALALRPALVTDLPSIYRGELGYIQQWEPAHLVAWRRQMERHLTRWVDNFERMTVAMWDGQFAGYSLWTAEDGFAELSTINVSLAYRRRGVGRVLLEAYLRASAQAGFAQWRLSVHPDNPARQLYEGAGFVYVDVGANGYLRYERVVG